MYAVIMMVGGIPSP